MNRFALLLAPALLLAACAQDADPAAETHGADTDAVDTSVEAAAGMTTETVGTAPSEGEVLPVAAVVERADELTGQTVRIEGEVAEVCQMEGCWLTFQQEGGTPVRVAIAHQEGGEGEEGEGGGHAFEFPRDIAGAHAIVEGTLEVKDTSVEMRRHLAEDAGASAEEIAAITEPQRQIVLNASGATLHRTAAPAETAAPEAGA